MKFKIRKGDFTLFIGDSGWLIDPRDAKYHCLIITSNGVFFDGKMICKGKLKLIKEN